MQIILLVSGLLLNKTPVKISLSRNNISTVNWHWVLLLYRSISHIYFPKYIFCMFCHFYSCGNEVNSSHTFVIHPYICYSSTYTLKQTAQCIILLVDLIYSGAGLKLEAHNVNNIHAVGDQHWWKDPLVWVVCSRMHSSSCRVCKEVLHLMVCCEGV